MNNVEASIRRPYSVSELFLPHWQKPDTPPVMEIVDTWHTRNRRSPSPDSNYTVLTSLNDQVINRTMSDTYHKIMDKGLPWDFGQGQGSREMMVRYLDDRIVTPFHRKHHKDNLFDKIKAERELLHKLARVGHARSGDVEGKNYGKYIDEVKQIDGMERQSMAEVVIYTCAPLLKIYTDLFASQTKKEKYKNLTREYEAIRHKADLWLVEITEAGGKLPLPSIPLRQVS